MSNVAAKVYLPGLVSRLVLLENNDLMNIVGDEVTRNCYTQRY